jgi:hypothetical protein
MSTADFFESSVTNLEFPGKYYYEFTSSNGLSVIVLRDEAPPKITDGRGGWNVIDRRRRKGLTTWTGRNPIRMDVPILFNGQFDPPYSIDQDVATLNQMALGDNFVQPPTVRVTGYLPVTGIAWVIEDLTWGDNAVWLRSDEGDVVRVRQDCVVKLLQFVKEDVVKVGNLGQVPSNTVPPYHTTEGETPAAIAKKVYGDDQMWKKIRDLNPSIVRSPNQALKGGLTLAMPPRHED